VTHTKVDSERVDGTGKFGCSTYEATSIDFATSHLHQHNGDLDYV
jgi:hypothetical protein